MDDIMTTWIWFIICFVFLAIGFIAGAHIMSIIKEPEPKEDKVEKDCNDCKNSSINNPGITNCWHIIGECHKKDKWQPKEKQMKIGDRVKLISRNCRGRTSGFEIGDVCTITNIDINSNPGIEIIRGTRIGYVNEKNIEKIEESNMKLTISLDKLCELLSENPCEDAIKIAIQTACNLHGNGVPYWNYGQSVSIDVILKKGIPQGELERTKKWLRDCGYQTEDKSEVTKKIESIEQQIKELKESLK
jgi:hypothetical protein